MISYRLKATKINKESEKEVRSHAKAACRHYNSLLSAGLSEYEKTKSVPSKNELKKICPKPEGMSTYHSEPVVERVHTVLTRYEKGEFGKPRSKNVQRKRCSLNVTIYSSQAHKVLVSQSENRKSATIAIPGTGVVLTCRTDSREIKGTPKRVSVVTDSCGTTWVNLTTDHRRDIVLPEAKVEKIGIDLGCREYAVCAGKQEEASYRTIKILHGRSLEDIKKEETKLANAQKNEDWRGAKAIYRRLQNKRKDYNHKLAINILGTGEKIYVGDVKSAFLFANKNSKVSRMAADACHGQLRLFLAQKAARATEKREVYLVREAYTSKTCGHCGHQNQIGSLKFWTCHNCGHWWDRDLNAALNMRSCKIIKCLSDEVRKQEEKYLKMRERRSQPRPHRRKGDSMRRATTPVGTQLQKARVSSPPAGKGKACTAEFASP